MGTPNNNFPFVGWASSKINSVGKNMASKAISYNLGRVGIPTDKSTYTGRAVNNIVDGAVKFMWDNRTLRDKALKPLIYNYGKNSVKNIIGGPSNKPTWWESLYNGVTK